MTWAKGQSGNPSGRPKVDPEVREAARAHTAAAIKRLATEMEDGDTSSARIRAAEVLLDRGWGKTVQPIAGDGENPLVVMTAEQRQREIEDNRQAALDALDAAFAVIDERPQPVPQDDRDRLLALPPQGTE